jgi:D-alanyl-D-alanine dipeptidase
MNTVNVKTVGETILTTIKRQFEAEGIRTDSEEAKLLAEVSQDLAKLHFRSISGEDVSVDLQLAIVALGNLRSVAATKARKLVQQALVTALGVVIKSVAAAAM